jgi:hypothetical protein
MAARSPVSRMVSRTISSVSKPGSTMLLTDGWVVKSNAARLSIAYSRHSLIICLKLESDQLEARKLTMSEIGLAGTCQRFLFDNESIIIGLQSMLI